MSGDHIDGAHSDAFGIAWTAQVTLKVSDKLLAVESSEVDGRHYIKVPKSNRTIETLLLATTAAELRPAIKKGRPLARTDVLEQLQKLREEKYNELLAGLQPPKPEKSTGLNEEESETTMGTRELAKLRVQMPKNAVIQAPTIGDVNGIELRVTLHAKHASPLEVELLAPNLQYLADACAWQIKDGTIHNQPRRRHHEKKSLPVGSSVSSIYSGKDKGKYRLIVRNGHESHQTKFEASNLDDAIDKAKKLKREAPYSTMRSSDASGPDDAVATDVVMAEAQAEGEDEEEEEDEI